MSCECVYSEGEPCEFANVKYVKARKNHICTECKREIVKGEEYELIKGKFEGDLFTDKTCNDCLSVRRAFFCGGCAGQIWEELYIHFDENDGAVDWDCVKEITPRARERLFELIEKVWAKIEKRETREKGIT